MNTRGNPYGFEIFDSCLSCRLQGEFFFCFLDQEALVAFDRMSFTSVYPAGAVLIAEGQSARGVFMLCRGRVKMSIAANDGKTLITRVSDAGEVLGLSESLTDTPHRATIETIEPTQVKFVKRDDFLRFIKEHSEACYKAAEQLSTECNIIGEHIRSLGLSHSAAEKLAHLILSWSDDGGKETERGVRIRVLMTHQEISQMIGTSRETVTRLLSEFRAKKILTTRGATMTIHNKPALEALVLL